MAHINRSCRLRKADGIKCGKVITIHKVAVGSIPHRFFTTDLKKEAVKLVIAGG